MDSVRDNDKTKEQLIAELEELRHQVAAMAALNHLKDNFLAMLSHQLRTPLNVILGCATLLHRTGKFEEGTNKRLIDTIERNALCQIKAIDDIVDVSRIMGGNFRLNLRPINPVLVIYGAIDLVRPTAETKNIRLVSLGSASVGKIIADRDRLQQVIWNLLSNAVKFTPAGGQIEVRLSIEPKAQSEIENRQAQNQFLIPHCVQIQVSDTGIGIEADFLPYIFERFHQPESMTNRPSDGMGMGLAIARHLVELHGGTICAESLGIGLGATFTVKLPLFEDNTKAEAYKSIKMTEDRENGEMYASEPINLPASTFDCAVAARIPN